MMPAAQSHEALSFDFIWNEFSSMPPLFLSFLKNVFLTAASHSIHTSAQLFLEPFMTSILCIQDVPVLAGNFLILALKCVLSWAGVKGPHLGAVMAEDDGAEVPTVKCLRRSSVYRGPEGCLLIGSLAAGGSGSKQR